METIKIYRVIIDRVAERVVDVIEHDGSITKTNKECLILPLEDALNYIKVLNGNFDVTILLEAIKKQQEGGEE
jgi:hypothetical protein